MQKLFKKEYMLLILLGLIICVSTVFFYYQQRILPLTVSEEENNLIAEYEKKCPFETIIFSDHGNEFKIIESKRSYNELFSDIDEGEEVLVQINTTSEEEGVLAFRKWLSENGLIENENLRVKFTYNEL